MTLILIAQAALLVTVAASVLMFARKSRQNSARQVVERIAPELIRSHRQPAAGLVVPARASSQTARQMPRI